MHSNNAPSVPQSQRLTVTLVWAVLAALVLIGSAAIYAQVSGQRGIAAVASSTDIDVRGIEVNVSGDSAEDARKNGWMLAQRIAWDRLGGPAIPDSRLNTMVAAIVVEEESVGPRRYVAKLGVIFDRQRAGGLLGAAGSRARSAPMLTLPVMVSAGTATMFELRNPWQRAWAEYQFGQSAIDYVRPSGSGGESLLLNYGQTSRRSRAWWNVVLDQFSAADVLVPVVRLEHHWPGGPVDGQFTARYGPDNRVLGQFALQAENDAGVPAMLESAVARFDELYRAALADGTLRPDPTLTLGSVEISPELRALLDSARAQNDTPADQGDGPAVIAPDAPIAVDTPVAAASVIAISVQVATPDGAAFDGALGGLRGVGGVRGVAVTSTAIGGTSVVRVNFAGSLSELAAALRSAGWQVTEGNNALAISR